MTASVTSSTIDGWNSGAKRQKTCGAPGTRDDSSCEFAHETGRFAADSAQSRGRGPQRVARRQHEQEPAHRLQDRRRSDRQHGRDGLPRQVPNQEREQHEGSGAPGHTLPERLAAVVARDAVDVVLDVRTHVAQRQARSSVLSPTDDDSVSSAEGTFGSSADGGWDFPRSRPHHDCRIRDRTVLGRTRSRTAWRPSCIIAALVDDEALAARATCSGLAHTAPSCVCQAFVSALTEVTGPGALPGAPSRLSMNSCSAASASDCVLTPAAISFSLATPQSMTATSPKSPIITLAGFKSRWMTPRACAYSMAKQTCKKTSSRRRKPNSAKVASVSVQARRQDVTRESDPHQLHRE